MAQKIIGLDVGSWSIKAMVMQSSLRRMSLLELREHHVPTDAFGVPLPGELPSSLKAVMAGLDADAIVAGVPGVQVLLREIELPFSDEKSVAPVLAFRLDGLLPRPVDTMVYDWHVLRKGPDGAHLLCPAADKVWLEQWTAQLRAGGADPRQLSLSMLAIENLAEHLDLPIDDSAVAVVDLGHRSTQVSLLRNGRVEAVRALSRGGHQITQAIARAMGVPYPDAERMKHEDLRVDGEAHPGSGLLGPADQAALLRAAAAPIETLLREVKLTIDALGALGRRGERPSRVILIGGTARLSGLPRLFEEQLGLEVESPRLKGIVWSELIADHRVREIGLPATALALEHVADATPHRVNLRRGDLGSLSDFSAIRARAGWIGAFLALILVVFFARKMMRISTLEGHEQQLAERLDDYASRVLNEKPDTTLTVPQRFADVAATVLAKPESETEQVYPQMTAFNMFFEVTRLQRQVNEEAQPQAGQGDDEPEEDEDGLPIPPKPAPEAKAPTSAAEKKMIELNSFSSDVKTPTTGAVTISGSGFDIVTIEKFATRLRQHACFKKVDRQETKKTNNPNRPGWTDFTIKIDVKCDIPSEAEVGRAESGRAAGGGED